MLLAAVVIKIFKNLMLWWFVAFIYLAIRSLATQTFSSHMELVPCDGAESEHEEEAKLRVCECGPECPTFVTAFWLKGGKVDADRVRFFRGSAGNSIRALAVECKRCYVPKGDYIKTQEELALMARYMEYDRNLRAAGRDNSDNGDTGDTYQRRTVNNRFSKAQLEVQPALGWLFNAQFRKLKRARECNPEWFH